MKPHTPDTPPIWLPLSPRSVATAFRDAPPFLFIHYVLPVVGSFIVASGLPVRIVVRIHLVGMVVAVIPVFHGCASLLVLANHRVASGLQKQRYAVGVVN